MPHNHHDASSFASSSLFPTVSRLGDTYFQIISGVGVFLGTA
jgi:hypothetical protein